MIDQVEIAAPAWQAIVAHAADVFPDECCGLLIGQGRHILHAHAATNIAAEPRRRFTVDPADHFDAIRRARAAGLHVIGAYHSHPAGEPRPSATDRAEAFEGEQFIHLIVRPPDEGRTAALAAYTLSGGNFVPLRLVRVP